MPSQINGPQPGADAMGALLGGISPQAGPPGGNPAAAGAGAVDQQTLQIMQRIQQFGEQVKQLGADLPMLADEVGQIQQILKQMVVKATAVAPVQTPSSMMVPGNGGGA